MTAPFGPRTIHHRRSSCFQSGQRKPPFCAVCGEEMLTVGDLDQPADANGSQPEWHAQEDLNPEPQNR